MCICCLLLEFRVKSEPENKEGKITFFVEFPFLFLRDTKRVTTLIHEEKKQLYFKIGERVSITAFISPENVKVFRDLDAICSSYFLRVYFTSLANSSISQLG